MRRGRRRPRRRLGRRLAEGRRALAVGRARRVRQRSAEPPRRRRARPTARRATATRRPGCRPTRPSAAPTSRARSRSSAATRRGHGRRARRDAPRPRPLPDDSASLRARRFLNERGVGLVVEGLDLGEACRAVEPARFARSARLVSSRTMPDAAPARVVLELGQDAPADAEPALAGATHMRLIPACSLVVELQRPAADRLAAAARATRRSRGARKQPRRRPRCSRGSKPASKRLSSSAKYDSMQNRAAVLVGSSMATADHPRGEQPLDHAHRLDQAGALAPCGRAARAVTRRAWSLRRSSRSRSALPARCMRTVRTRLLGPPGRTTTSSFSSLSVPTTRLR